MRRSPAMAPSAASRPSALSSARVTTICGNTTPVLRGSSGRRSSSTSGVASKLASGVASVIGGLQWISVITPLREIHNRPQPICIPDTSRRISPSPRPLPQRQKVAICFRSETNRYLLVGSAESEQAVVAHPGDGALETLSEGERLVGEALDGLVVHEERRREVLAGQRDQAGPETGGHLGIVELRDPDLGDPLVRARHLERQVAEPRHTAHVARPTEREVPLP